LGAANYESANQTFPNGRNCNRGFGSGGSITGCIDGWSHLARLLNHIEQTQVYNAINFSDTPYGARNSTAESVGISFLWCPSDGTISGLRFYEQGAGWDGTTVPITYTDYAGMLGTYCPTDGRSPSAPELSLENGVYPDVGAPLSAGGNGDTRLPVRILDIKDGTSNTIAWAEICHAKYSQAGCDAYGCCDWTGSGWWADADYNDSTITSFYPPNISIPASYYTTGKWVAPDNCDGHNNIPPMTSMSLHPGGVNVAFADGSVHFIMNSISSWNSLALYSKRSPTGNAIPDYPGGPGGPGVKPKCTIPAGVTPGVWQALSTIAGGEAISSDQY
jgi:prepilin-type processing-associated H-X9-DG protein